MTRQAQVSSSNDNTGYHACLPVSAMQHERSSCKQNITANMVNSMTGGMVSLPCKLYDTWMVQGSLWHPLELLVLEWEFRLQGKPFRQESCGWSW